MTDDVFSITLPQVTAPEPSALMSVADGCNTNTNYYTTKVYDSTCCCSCDKS